MITEIFTPVDDECEQSLIKIQDVINSESYLAGLGKLCKDYPVPSSFNVITDYKRSTYLLTSQEMWHEQNDDQNFAEVLGDAVDYLGKNTYDDSEAKRRMTFFEGSDKSNARREYIRDTTKKAYNQNGIADFLFANFHDVNPSTIDSFREYDLNGYIEDCFGRFIRAAYFGGLQNWPVCEHLLKCFSIGGFPTGWVGPLARDGGKSEKCMQLLHFGPEA